MDKFIEATIISKFIGRLQMSLIDLGGEYFQQCERRFSDFPMRVAVQSEIRQIFPGKVNL